METCCSTCREVRATSCESHAVPLVPVEGLAVQRKDANGGRWWTVGDATERMMTRTSAEARGGR